MSAHGSRRFVHWLVCLLMVCIPLQGMAMVMERIQGAAHVHVSAVAAQQAGPNQPLPADMALLLAVRELRHSHGAARHHVGPEAAPGSTSIDIDPSAHHHDLVGRHLHEPDDATVLSVDDPAADADAASGATSKRVLLDMDTPPIVLVARAAEPLPRAPLAANEDSPVQPEGRRLERPPRPSQR